MDWRGIRNVGFTLLIGPLSSLVLTLTTGFNWIVYSLGIMLFTLSAILILSGIVGERFLSSNIQVIPTEEIVQKRIIEIANQKDVASIDFISAGVSSRKTLLLRIIKECRKPIRILFQNPSVAVSNKERISTVKAMYDIAVDIGSIKWNSEDVQFYEYKTRASLRASIFRNKDGVAIAAILSWYVYLESNSAISGSRQPSILVTKSSGSSEALIKFVDSQFQQKLRSATRFDYVQVETLSHNEN